MSFYNKYRPTTLSEFHGNEEVKTTINSMIENNNLPHTILLYSDYPGVGKTTLGRIIAKQMGCDDFDLTEMDIGSLTGVQNSREIQKLSKYKPAKGSYRFWILDEIANASRNAQEALLKLLEEPPTHAYFILCTTDPQKLLNTIKSRSSQFKIQPAAPNTIQRILKDIANGEEIEVPRKVIHKISKNVNGQIRDALNIFEQVINSDDMENTLEKEIESRTQGIELCRELAKGGGADWNRLAKILKNMDSDPEPIRRMVLNYFYKPLLQGKEDGNAYIIMDCFDEPFFNNGFAGLVKSTFEAYKELE